MTESSANAMRRPAPIRAVTTLYHSSVVRYLAIGGTSFIIDFSLLFLLHEGARLPLWISTAVAFLASFLFNYTLQRIFSFGSRRSHGVTLAKYITLVVFNTVATTLIVSAFDQMTNGWEWGKVCATLITTCWNYLAYRYWVFADSPKSGRSNHSHVVIGQVVDDPSHTIEHRKDSPGV